MSQSFISTLVCVLGILSFTRPITAQTAAPVDSAVIKGSADTPDHPLLHQPKATSTGRKIMRAPANTVGLIFKGHSYGRQARISRFYLRRGRKGQKFWINSEP